MELLFSYHISGKTATNPSTPVKSFKIKIEVYVSALLPDRRRETSNQVKKTSLTIGPTASTEREETSLTHTQYYFTVDFLTFTF